jgi:hypothetical protein
MRRVRKDFAFITLAGALILLAACQSAPATAPTPPVPTPPSFIGATPNPVPAQQTWVFCSNAYQGCGFTGLRDVRIGSGTKWVVKEFFAGVDSCRSERFDTTDPNGDGGKTCEVSTHVKTGTLAPPLNPMGPTVDLTRIPLGSKGYSDVRVRQTSSSPAEQPTKHDDTTGGEFRTHCDYSHMSFDDPIVYPGQVGRAHLHTFFGNTRAWAGSTAFSIAETGNSTCAGGIANRTAYWVPTLIDTKDGTALAPEGSIWYYKNGWGGIPAKDIRPMPKGLRMIAGNPNGKRPEDVVHGGWGCWNGGGGLRPAVRTDCAVGDYVVMTVVFPQCWNGKDLDSSDHISHLSYEVKNGQCPAAYPVAIPQISLNLKYLVRDASAPARWRLSSDMYPTTQPGGYSVHADWFDGWQEDIKNAWVQHCNTAGFDCHGFLLGDGRTLY